MSKWSKNADVFRRCSTAMTQLDFFRRDYFPNRLLVLSAAQKHSQVIQIFDMFKSCYKTLSDHRTNVKQFHNITFSA